jgi:enoyl-CoA hydratase
MEREQIADEVQGSTAIVTLNRRERRNALSGTLLHELDAALRDADEYSRS